MFAKDYQCSQMLTNVFKGLPLLTNISWCSPMFTNVFHCFPLFSNVRQCSPRFPLKFPLAGSPQVFKCFFFFFFVFFFTQCHISLSHFYGHNRFWERGAIFQSESKKISQVTRWSLHLRSHHTSIVVWKKNTVIVGRTFSGQISKMCEIAFHQLLARKFENL